MFSSSWLRSVAGEVVFAAGHLWYPLLFNKYYTNEFSNVHDTVLQYCNKAYIVYSWVTQDLNVDWGITVREFILSQK
jgi:hypothetical protein